MTEIYTLMKTFQTIYLELNTNSTVAEVIECVKLLSIIENTLLEKFNTVVIDSQPLFRIIKKQNKKGLKYLTQIIKKYRKLVKFLEKNKLPCTMDESLIVWVNIIPQKKGFYIQGKITGAVFLPCNRCLEQARVVIDNSFRLFEEFEPVDPEYVQKPLLRFAEGRWELDLQHLFWEQFVLALPDKYLCSENCKGLCPYCGQNLNEKSCSCEQNAGDPRLAVLKQFKIKGKS